MNRLKRAWQNLCRAYQQWQEARRYRRLLLAHVTHELDRAARGEESPVGPGSGSQEGFEKLFGYEAQEPVKAFLDVVRSVIVQVVAQERSAIAALLSRTDRLRDGLNDLNEEKRKIEAALADLSAPPEDGLDRAAAQAAYQQKAQITQTKATRFRKAAAWQTTAGILLWGLEASATLALLYDMIEPTTFRAGGLTFALALAATVGLTKIAGVVQREYQSEASQLHLTPKGKVGACVLGALVVLLVVLRTTDLVGDAFSLAGLALMGISLLALLLLGLFTAECFETAKQQRQQADDLTQSLWEEERRASVEPYYAAQVSSRMQALNAQNERCDRKIRVTDRALRRAGAELRNVIDRVLGPRVIRAIAPALALTVSRLVEPISHADQPPEPEPPGRLMEGVHEGYDEETDTVQDPNGRREPYGLVLYGHRFSEPSQRM